MRKKRIFAFVYITYSVIRPKKMWIDIALYCILYMFSYGIYRMSKLKCCDYDYSYCWRCSEFQIQFQILNFHLIFDSIRLVDDSKRSVSSTARSFTLYKLFLIYPILLKAQIVDAQYTQLHITFEKSLHRMADNEITTKFNILHHKFYPPTATATK